jgi:hypothetical protein
MSNADVLKDIIDASPGLSETAQEAMDAIDVQIAEAQEKQDALKFQLDSLKTDLETAIGAGEGNNKFFAYDEDENGDPANYYTGSLLSIDDNIEQWQSFFRKSEDVIFESVDEFKIDGNAESVTFNGSGLDDMQADTTAYIENKIVHYKIQIDSVGATDTFKWSDSGGLIWNETNVAMTGIKQYLSDNIIVRFLATTGHTSGDLWEFWIIPIGSEIYFDGSDQTEKRIEGVVTSVVYDSTSTTVAMNMSGPAEIPADLTEVIVYDQEPGGTGWDSDPDTNDLQAMIDEFDFANQFIHLPLGLSGTYGTKDTIEKLQLAKTLQQNNKDNADDTPDGLARYATP